MWNQFKRLKWKTIDWRTRGARLANGNWLHLTSLQGGEYALYEFARDDAGTDIRVRDYGFYRTPGEAQDCAIRIARRRAA